MVLFRSGGSKQVHKAAGVCEGARCQLFGIGHVLRERIQTKVLIVQASILEWYLLWS